MIDHQTIRYLGDIPEAQARLRGDAVALEFEGARLSYDALNGRTAAAAAVLANFGVMEGDRVAWLSKNSELFFEVFFGAARIRACLAPINFRLSPAEIAFILNDSGASVFFVSQDFLRTAQDVVAQSERPIRLVSLKGAAEGFDTYEALRDAVLTPLAAAPQKSDDDVLQLYTSGTTGLPKGVRLTNANYECFLRVSPTVEGFDYNSEDVVLIVMPLFHVAGTNVSFAGLAHGCKVIVVADFSPAAVLKLIEDERVAHIFIVPSMIQMLLQAPEAESADVSSLKSIAYGASPISEAVLAAAKARFGCQFIQFYGMTESTGGGSYLSPSAHTPDKLRSCGLPWPGVEVKICGAEGPLGPDAAEGHVGQIAIRGAIVMKGYWKRPEATAEAVVDGWLLTGDAGYRDKANYLYIHDRVKDMIVSGGENIYPAEVENAIFGCPGVADVAVVGVPSDRWGEEVKAVVVPAAGDPPNEQAVIAWARERIAGYKARASTTSTPCPATPRARSYAANCGKAIGRATIVE